MTGDEHYKEAERLLYQSRHNEGRGDFYQEDSRDDVAAAQVHATLALAARLEGTAVALDDHGVTLRSGFENLWSEMARKR